MSKPATFVLRLLVQNESRTVPLPTRGSLTIGRGASCEVQLAEPAASRQHARLHVDGGVWLEDLGSVNGTYVSSVVIEDPEAGTPHCEPRRLAPRERVELGQGDTVRIGGALLVLWPETPGTSATGRAVVADPAMQALYAELDQIADTPLSVLIAGETGVGKELIAEQIVRRSSRRDGPFLRLNCAAFQESLLESEIFGHERGAFTGAHKAKPGLFEAADGGTVLLDEIGEMPSATQVKLLRVLESRQVLRIGALAPRAIDVRFIAATNRDLDEQVREGRFRPDLFFRLNGVTLRVPPLRERPADVEPLAREFAARASASLGRAGAPEFDADAIAALKSHAWPGNVRELKNVVERAVALARSMRITLAELPPEIALRAPSSQATPAAFPALATEAVTIPPPAAAPDVDQDRERILWALDESAGNQTRAAKLLGISRNTLIARLERYGIRRPRK